MEIARFKKMLALYGADMKRWEGEDMETARAFMAESPKAQALYRQAQALDSALAAFHPDTPDPALLEKAMACLDAAPNMPGSLKEKASVLRFPAERKQRSVAQRGVFWGSLSAVAAAFILFVSTVPEFYPEMPPAASGTPDVGIVLAELENLSEEEAVQREMLGLLEVAAAKSRRVTTDDIDAFLDEILSQPGSETKTQEEMDLWQMFLESRDVQEL